MKVITINKEDWAGGLERLYDSFRLFGPVRQDEFHIFKELEKGELPDMNLLNTRLSPKSIVYPQSETMFEYTLDENRDDHHILKEIDKNYSPRAGKPAQRGPCRHGCSVYLSAKASAGAYSPGWRY